MADAAEEGVVDQGNIDDNEIPRKKVYIPFNLNHSLNKHIEVKGRVRLEQARPFLQTCRPKSSQLAIEISREAWSFGTFPLLTERRTQSHN